MKKKWEKGALLFFRLLVITIEFYCYWPKIQHQKRENVQTSNRSAKKSGSTMFNDFILTEEWTSNYEEIYRKNTNFDNILFLEFGSFLSGFEFSIMFGNFQSISMETFNKRLCEFLLSLAFHFFYLIAQFTLLSKQ